MSSSVPLSQHHFLSFPKTGKPIYLEQNKRVQVLQHAVIDEKSFEQLFKTHYNALHAYAFSIMQDEVIAEEIVQNLFLKIWEKKEQLSEQISAKAYLYKCIHHNCLNYIRHNKVKDKYEAHISYTNKQLAEADAAAGTELTELQKQINLALNQLPQQCRTIFQMSRFEELKYREIAEELNISVKTVENQMGKALKFMRLKLADFLTLLLCLGNYFISK